MRSTFRMSKGRRFQGFVLLALVGSLFAAEQMWPSLFGGGPSQAFGASTVVLFVAIGFFSVLIILKSAYMRIEATDTGIEAFDALNRKSFELRYDQITAYRKQDGYGWLLQSESATYSLPEIDLSGFHALIAQRRPEALTARVLRCGQVPPAQNFTDMIEFDAMTWIKWVLGFAALTGLTVALVRSWGIAICALNPATQALYNLSGLFCKISITDIGVTYRTPFGMKSIPWDAATAVFREGAGISRRYTLTAPGIAIVIPGHIVSNGEIMRKLLYSLPDGTRLVGFESSGGGRTRGRRKRVADAPPNRLPELAGATM